MQSAARSDEPRIVRQGAQESAGRRGADGGVRLMVKSASDKQLAVDYLRDRLTELAVEHEDEYPFAKALKRRWRSDIAIPAEWLLVEVEGGTWSGGRHTRGKGYENDCEKYNTAVLLGWRVLRFTSGQVWNIYAENTILKALGTL